MSRLKDIIENHTNLDELFAILKHYGVNAEFISGALLNEFERLKEAGEELEQEEQTNELVEDLTKYSARF